MKKRIISLLLVVVLLFSYASVTSLALNDLSNLTVSIPSVREVSAGVYINETVENNIHRASIDSSSISKVRELIATDECGALDLCRDVLIALGLSEQTIESLTDAEILSKFTDYLEMTVEVKHIRVGEDGMETILSEEECLEQAAIAEAQRMEYIESRINLFMNQDIEGRDSSGGSRGSINDGYDVKTDAYMRITTESNYIVHTLIGGEKGWYDFIGTFEWLSTPSARQVDALSLYADGFLWSQNASDYQSFMNYKKLFITLNGEFNQEVSIDKSGAYREMRTGGVFFDWELPDDDTNFGLYAIFCYDFSFSIEGRARVASYHSGCTFKLYTRYI